MLVRVGINSKGMASPLNPVSFYLYEKRIQYIQKSTATQKLKSQTVILTREFQIPSPHI